jgi:histidine triad (HIT) family protein
MGCLFCKIVSREIPSKIVLEDEHLLAFEDIRPAAPKHALVIPKKHIVGLREATEEDEALLGKLLLAARKVGDALGVGESGFRTVINQGPNAGQSVFHLHVHVLGGRGMAWPPG